MSTWQTSAGMRAVSEYGDYTHYDTLEVDEDASQEIIGSAYQYLCHKWHPKRHPDDHEKAEKKLAGLSRAYRVISQPDKRAEYDRWLLRQRGEKSPAKAVFGEQQFKTRPSDLKHTTENNQAPEAEFVDSDSSATPPPKFSKADFQTQNYDATFHGGVQGGDEIVFAKFWHRGAATMLDGLVTTVLTLIVVAIAALASLLSVTIANISVWQLWQLAGWPVALFYYCAMTTRPRSATVGQRFLGMKVLSVRGEGMSLPHAALRTVIRTFLLIFAIIQPFTRNRQALHDLLTGTVVVTSPEHLAKHSTGKAVAIVLFVTVLYGGIIAGITIPAYTQYMSKAVVAAAYSELMVAASAVTENKYRGGDVPSNLAEIGYVPSTPNGDWYGPAIYSDKENTFFIHVDFASEDSLTANGGRLAVFPYLDDNDKLFWECYAFQLDASLVPNNCEIWREQD